MSFFEPLFDTPPNQKFAGREDILKSMQDQMIDETGRPLPGASVLLYGLGGMGKSSIAVKYIYDNYTKYEPYIFWIPSDTYQKFNSAILEACHRLKLPLDHSDVDLAKAPRLWRNWLEQTDRPYLVVFDNLEEEIILDVWPRTSSGTIIVTSRRRHVSSQFVRHEHEVAAMSLSGSHNLLLNLLTPALRDKGTRESSTVTRICSFLDGLPLAITVAASMICACQSLEGILKRLEKTTKTLLEWSPTSEHTAPLCLMVLWDTSLENLPESSLHLLQVMALLDPDDLFEEIGSHEITAASSLQLPSTQGEQLRALASLSDHSLIRRDRSSLCMHRLLQDVIVERMDPDTLRMVFDAAILIVRAVFPKQADEGLLMSSFWLQCQKYRSHVESLVRRYKQQSGRLGTSPAYLAELTYRCSWSMYESGMYVRAIQLAQTGLDLVIGPKCETMLLQADLWTTIGGSQLLATSPEDSYCSLKKAFDLRMNAVESGLMEPRHAQIANSYMSLGTAALGVGNLQEAIKLGKKSVELRLGREEGQFQMLAMSHHNVALASLCAGLLDDAEKHSKTSTEISYVISPSMTMEQRHAMDARNVYGLANIYLAQGKLLEGRNEHQKALQVRLEVFKETHPYTACSYWKLGRLWEADDWTKAVEYYQKSVDVYEEVLLVQATLGRSLHHLGMLLRQHGDARGDEYIKRAADIYRKLSGQELKEDANEPFKEFIHPFYS